MNFLAPYVPRLSSIPQLRFPAARARWLACCGGALLLAAGCATRAPAAPAGELALPEAAAAGLEQLMPPVATPAWLTSLRGRSLLLEPVQDKGTRQQTRATQIADRALAERLRAAYAQVKLLPFDEASVAQATWALAGELVSGRAAVQSGPSLHLALFDVKTGKVVAQTTIKVRADSVDTTPTTFYLDSPVLMSGPAAPAAATAADASAPINLVEALSADALSDRAMSAYDAGNFGSALQLFEAAKKLRGADPLRVETGLYLVYSRLGRAADAKQAFGTIASIGIARRSLGVKFLFEPGKVEFWSDPSVSGPYGMWLEQIADRSKGSNLCLNVVGHASHTGTDEFNNKLSLDRAIQIGDKLKGLAPELALRLQENGMGFRENLIGTGTDDARDALDRRVEFRFDGC
jgi:outer membrane protein OmpA-like peptidoglycan-associated protein